MVLHPNVLKEPGMTAHRDILPCIVLDHEKTTIFAEEAGLVGLLPKVCFLSLRSLESRLISDPSASRLRTPG